MGPRVLLGLQLPSCYLPCDERSYENGDSQHHKPWRSAETCAHCRYAATTRGCSAAVLLMVLVGRPWHCPAVATQFQGVNHSYTMRNSIWRSVLLPAYLWGDFSDAPSPWQYRGLSTGSMTAVLREKFRYTACWLWNAINAVAQGGVHLVTVVRGGWGDAIALPGDGAGLQRYHQHARPLIWIYWHGPSLRRIHVKATCRCLVCNLLTGRWAMTHCRDQQ